MKTCSNCGKKHYVAFDLCEECGAKLPDETVDDIVAAWFEGEQTMFDAVHDAPEVAWAAILQILDRELTEEQISILAAGPLGDLLAKHGSKFIERIECEAKKNPHFNYLLGGVRKSEIANDVWERVQNARKETW
jgi:hypothetical protein